MAEQQDGVLKLQHACLQYLDSLRFITNIKEKCAFYNNIQDIAFHFTIPIEPDDLLKINSNLGTLLLNNPYAAGTVFQEVVYTTVKTLSLLEQCETASQIVIVFRLQSIPHSPSYQLCSTKDFICHGRSKRFLEYTGVVCGMSTLHKYTKSARFLCPESHCTGSEGNHFIRIHTPGSRETQTIRTDFKCTFCGALLEEDLSCRVLADKLVVKLLDENAFDSANQRTSRRHQSIITYFRDELGRDIQIGQRIHVVGIPVLDWDTLALEVNNILKEPKIKTEGADVSALPECIQQLYQDRRNSPWGFGLSLAYVFGGEVAAPGTFLHLKLGLLLSLIWDMSKDTDTLDLLVACSDSLLINRLFSYSAQLSKRHIIHTVSNHMCVCVNKDDLGSGSCFIEGGSVLMAHGGVCVIKQLGDLKTKVQQALLQALETGSVFVDIPKKLSRQTDQQMFIPRKCCVWACVEKTKKGDFGNVPPSLINTFGMVFFTDVEAESYADYMLTHQVLMTAMGNNTENVISQEQFKQLLNICRDINVEFTPESERLIKGYYVGSRRVRAQNGYDAVVPISAIKTISGFAAAHTKLNLRTQVTEFDATMAIYLYEESVTRKTSFSILNVDPMPHVLDNDMQRYLGAENDAKLNQFYLKLVMFIDTHASDVDYVPEE